MTLSSKERREKIMQVIRKSGTGKVEDFVREFNVSAVTIRHDLNLLEKEGCLFRCYGGASLNPNFAFDQPLQSKGRLNQNAKQSIAKVAAEQINSGEAVIFDSGSTLALMPKYLRQKKLIVMTNALNIAHQLSSMENIELHVLGGSLRKASYSLVGSYGEKQMRSYLFDKVFLGVDGFDLEAGITTPDLGEAHINRTMCEVSRKVIAVTDSSKIGRKSFCTICAASEIDLLITDSNIPHDIHQALIQTGVEVILADKAVNQEQS